MKRRRGRCSFFFFNDTATTEIYTLSLHDALPICVDEPELAGTLEFELAAGVLGAWRLAILGRGRDGLDRKSTRLNSSHLVISYAVFCLKKKKKSKMWQDCSFAKRFAV